MLNVVLLSAAFFAVMLTVIMLIVDMLGVIMLSARYTAITQNVITLSAALFFLKLSAFY